ncbi:hypothetical protein [Mycolicibacterium sphagni]|uniref:Keratin associated protein n=1 Tax=Mycolicibacterium sphagni TaxID=1786 RepID=A0A255DU15_9MYCO|nr:hypothetical protein [Mycolicibacterium sphagni]MCV7176090.1 hypothetical protein [Mycolicibacterium sphagni]OYN82714.1 hypothetical protein CG716_00375 [Mycolicibacterium sphagni]
MKINLRLAAGTLAAGAAICIAGAPIAAADQDPHLVCTDISPGNSQCQTPGNAQLSATPPDVPYPTMYPFLFGTGVIINDAPGNHGMH